MTKCFRRCVSPEALNLNASLFNAFCRNRGTDYEKNIKAYLYPAYWRRIVLSVSIVFQLFSIFHSSVVWMQSAVERVNLWHVLRVSYGKIRLFHQLDVTPDESSLKKVSL